MKIIKTHEEELEAWNCSSNLQILAVTGIPGLGKSTMIKNFCQKRFDSTMYFSPTSSTLNPNNFFAIPNISLSAKERYEKTEICKTLVDSNIKRIAVIIDDVQDIISDDGIKNFTVILKSLIEGKIRLTHSEYDFSDKEIKICIISNTFNRSSLMKFYNSGFVLTADIRRRIDLNIIFEYESERYLEIIKAEIETFAPTRAKEIIENVNWVLLIGLVDDIHNRFSDNIDFPMCITPKHWVNFLLLAYSANLNDKNMLKVIKSTLVTNRNTGSLQENDIISILCQDKKRNIFNIFINRDTK